MNKATVCIICLWMFVVSAEAVKPKECPVVPCPGILYPPSCRSITFFLHGKDKKVCRGCDNCVAESDRLDGNGCPLRACTMQLIPDKCRREIYYVYQGRTICKDCPQDTCNVG